MLGGVATLRFEADRVVMALVVPLIAVGGSGRTFAAPRAGLRVASLDDDHVVRVVTAV